MLLLAEKKFVFDRCYIRKCNICSCMKPPNGYPCSRIQPNTHVHTDKSPELGYIWDWEKTVNSNSQEISGDDLIKTYIQVYEILGQ